MVATGFKILNSFKYRLGSFTLFLPVSVRDTDLVSVYVSSTHFFCHSNLSDQEHNLSMNQEFQKFQIQK